MWIFFWFRISVIYRCAKPIFINGSKVNYSQLGGSNRWHQGTNRQRLLEVAKPNQFAVRGYALLVGRILRGVLKIRYLVLGGAVGGTVTLNKVSFIMFRYEMLTIFLFRRNMKLGETDCPTCIGWMKSFPTTSSGKIFRTVLSTWRKISKTQSRSVSCRPLRHDNYRSINVI